MSTEQVFEFNVLYVGERGAGRTTNLQYIHETLRRAQESGTSSALRLDDVDVTGFFDLVNVSMVMAPTLRVALHLHAPSSIDLLVELRRLQRFDGIVFVADTQPEALADGAQLLGEVRQRLREAAHQAPLVVQLNKRDLSQSSSAAELVDALGAADLPHLDAVAPIGTGVFDTLKVLTRLMLVRSREQLAESA